MHGRENRHIEATGQREMQLVDVRVDHVEIPAPLRNASGPVRHAHPPAKAPASSPRPMPINQLELW